MTQIQNNTQLQQALNLDKMSEKEREEVASDFLELSFEAALGRLLLGLSDAEQASLELYLDTHQDDDSVSDYLLKKYPIFSDYLEEELQALQEEAITVMG